MALRLTGRSESPKQGLEAPVSNSRPSHLVFSYLLQQKADSLSYSHRRCGALSNPITKYGANGGDRLLSILKISIYFFSKKKINPPEPLGICVQIKLRIEYGKI